MNYSFYALELLVTERVNAAVEDGLRSQAIHRSGVLKTGPLHGLRQSIQEYLDRQMSETPLIKKLVKPLSSNFVRVTIVITLLLVLIYFGL